MEKNHESNLDESKIDLKDLEEKVKESINLTDMEKDLSNLGVDSKVDNVISDLFYKSVKMIFDVGFNLAKKLNLDLFDSFEFFKKNDKK